MKTKKTEFPGQVVLVLQGGGALGAYQVGVYEAMHEAGVEPDWVIGTSIGAINAALIAGNPPEKRFARLSEFWRKLEHGDDGFDVLRLATGLANLVTNLNTVTLEGILEPCPARTVPSDNCATARVRRADRQLTHGCGGHSRLFQAQSICLRWSRHTAGRRFGCVLLHGTSRGH